MTSTAKWRTFMFVCMLVSEVACRSSTDCDISLEGRILAHIGDALDRFARANGGHMPSDWQDFEVNGVLKFDEELPTPLSDRYAFVKDRIPVAENRETGEAVLIGTRPTKEPNTKGEGRYVIWRTDRGGHVRVTWFAEADVEHLLKAGVQTRTRKLSIKPSLKVTNPNATIVRGEPICVQVDVVATEATVLDVPEFVFSVRRPGSQYDIPMLNANLLAGGAERGSLKLGKNGKNELGITFFATVFAVDTDEKGAKSRVLLSLDPGDYELKLRDLLSGDESAGVMFKVIEGADEDRQAVAMLKSQGGLGLFYGDPNDLFPFERLLRSHPSSQLAAYSALVVGNTKLQQLEAAGREEKSEQEIAALDHYFDKALSPGFRSIFELKAMLGKARCLTAKGELAARQEVLLALINQYGDVYGVPHLDTLYKHFVALDSVPSLVQLCTGNDLKIRKIAFERMHQLGARAQPAVPALIKMLQNSDTDGRRQAAEALGPIGRLAEDAVPHLLEAILDEDSEVQSNANWALRGVLGWWWDRGFSEVPGILKSLEAGDKGERRIAAWKLVWLTPFPKEAVPRLSAVLKDDDEVLSVLAAKALASGRESAESAVPDLLAAAQRPSPAVRRAAFAALGRVVGPQHQNAIPVFTKALADEDRKVQQYATSALLRMGSTVKPALPALTEALRSADKSVHASVAELLANLRSEAKPAAPALLDCLQHDHPDRDRSSIILSLVTIDPEQRDLAIPMFIRWLTNESAVTRDNARVRMKSFDPSVSVPSLAAALEQGNENVREEVAQTLGEIGPAAVSAIPALADSLKKPGERARTAAAVAMASIQPSTDAILLVTRMIDHPDEHVRHRVAERLKELGPRAAPAVPTLISELNDYETEWVRAEVCYALREIGPAAEEAIPALRREMSRGAQYSDVAAAGALAKLSPKEKRPIEYLIKALKERDAIARPVAAECLGALGSAAAPAVPALTDALKDPEPEVPAAALEALGKVGKDVPGVIPALVSALGESGLRSAAIQILGDFGPPAKSAVPALQKLLEDDDVVIRTMAVEALKKIGEE